ncbi:MAG: hypothetical protein HFACDABA_02199 [Anaerolineales bacterium]|nr:hypothetical protein [Anaerolineales bacterium]
MSLFTFNFLFFVLVTALVYFLAPPRRRWAILLIASAGFYISYSVFFAFVLAIVIVVNYWLGILIERGERNKKGYLVAGVLFNVGLLALYKFAAPVLESAPFFQNHSSYAAWLAMPIGLSFHTLQAVAYLVEVFRDGHAAERHAGVFALSILFFPRVLSGPIEKPSLLDQFKAETPFDAGQARAGMKLMARGFFKKMFIAERLAPLVNQVFADPVGQSGATLSLTMLIYMIVLYTDFSGYSDIAVGTARIFGIRLIQNFDHPYSARSFSEFWQRWHISLSNWLRDYVFFPLRRWIMRSKWPARIPFAATVIPPMAAMLVSGFWHGSNWTFVVWGGLHGGYLVFFQITDPFWQAVARRTRLDRLPRLTAFLQQTITFVLVTFSFVFFRANTLADAVYVIRHFLDGVPDYFMKSWLMILKAMFGWNEAGWDATLRHILSPLYLDTGFNSILIGLSLLAFLWMEWTRFDLERLRSRPVYVRWAAYALFLAVCLLFSVQATVNTEFIYFRF